MGADLLGMRASLPRGAVGLRTMDGLPASFWMYENWAAVRLKIELAPSRLGAYPWRWPRLEGNGPAGPRSTSCSTFFQKPKKRRRGPS